MFEKNDEWSGYKVRKSKSGFIVMFWSRVQGSTDGDKYLYKFDKIFTKTTDLNNKWNEFMTYGEYLANIIRTQYKTEKEYSNEMNIKCLSKGNIVL